MAVGLPTVVAEVDCLRRRTSALFSWRHAFQGLVDSEFVVVLLEWVELSQKKVLSYEGLGSSRLEQAAHAARQKKENEQPGLHDANLQSVAPLHKPADLGIRHPQGLKPL